ncbi:MAG: ABC transporter ATP-binding protein [Planctomycetes bacterium]|nr:ABC transporter ATP-binding protein [Planctomycetota bacterium]
MSSVIEVRKLGRRLKQAGGEKAILNELSFELASGEFLCIMGPSGSGKTTLLHLLAGLDLPDEGTILIEGKAMDRLGEDGRAILRRERIAQVFQFFNLMPALSLRENVALPLAIAGRPAGEQRARIDGLIERFGLGHRADALPSALSGGEMQRASIARALAGGQGLLLCDEPTGNLSQQSGLEVMQSLRRLRDEDGKSILLVTHNPRDAAFSDRVLFLVDGRLDPDHELRGPGLEVERIHRSLAELAI